MISLGCPLRPEKTEKQMPKRFAFLNQPSIGHQVISLQHFNLD